MQQSYFSRKTITTVLKVKIILTIRLDRLCFLTRQSSQTFLLYFLPTSRRRDDDDAHKKISADEFADEPKLLLTSLFRSDTFCSFLWICKEKSSMSFWTLSHSCGCGSWIWLGDRPVLSIDFCSSQSLISIHNRRNYGIFRITLISHVYSLYSVFHCNNGNIMET